MYAKSYVYRDVFVIIIDFQGELGEAFFVSRLLGLVYAAGSKKKQKTSTLNTRGCSFWVPLNTRGGLTHTPLGKNTHWTRECAVLSTSEHVKVPYTHATRCTQRYKSAYTHWKDAIHTVPGITNTIPGPFFLKNTIEICYRFAFLSCSVCFFWSLNLVYPALRLSTRAFLGRWFRVCDRRICE